MGATTTGLSAPQQRAIAAFIHAGFTDSNATALIRAARGWFSVMTPDLVLAAAEGIAVHLLAQWELDNDPDPALLGQFAETIESTLGGRALLVPQSRQLWLQAAACTDPDRSIRMVAEAAGPAASDLGLLAYNYALFATELVMLWSEQTGQGPGPVLQLALNNL
jgi:hypothetical protein